MNTIRNSQKKRFIGAQTEAAAENAFAQPQTKQPIGFKQKESQVFQPEASAGAIQLHDLDPVFGLPRSSSNHLTELLVSIADTYFDKRANHCHRQGAEQELLERMEKLFIKFFDKIV